jgi:transglutaminase-like putative cysteine protease
VTPAVSELAERITRGKADVPAQAEALFKWVSQNIRYVAVYFGSGRYVPNDTGTILSRRFRDCKDDATLLSALLAAKGIDSEQVLLDTDPAYRFAKTATLGAFNHVIVYIPALDRYVDPTVPFGSFARLPSSDAGKPVVRVSARGAVIAKTPLPSVEDNVVEIDTRLVTKADGHREGETGSRPAANSPT